MGVSKVHIHLQIFLEPRPQKTGTGGGGRDGGSIPNALRSCLGCFQSETADRLAEPALTFEVASAFRRGCCAPPCLRRGECVGGPLCHCQCPHHSGHVLSVCDRKKRGDVGSKCWLSKSHLFSRHCGHGGNVFATTFVLCSTESSPNAGAISKNHPGLQNGDRLLSKWKPFFALCCPKLQLPGQSRSPSCRMELLAGAIPSRLRCLTATR